MALWEEIQRFLAQPQPPASGPLSRGEMRYVMGTHRLYLEPGVSLGPAALAELQELAVARGLALELREAPGEDGRGGNVVVNDGSGSYLGRFTSEIVILMPQHLEQGLFEELLALCQRHRAE